MKPSKYTQRVLQEAYQISRLQDGGLTYFAKAKGLSRSMLYTKLGEWKKVRGLT